MTKRYLRFWGVRGSYAAPFESHVKVGGNTSCVEIRDGNHLLICDAGTGIIPLGNELMKQDEIRDMMVILTHYHWDHICGLPFFVPAFSPDWNITFFGPGREKSELQKHFSEQMRAPYFPVSTETWLANINYLVPEKSPVEWGPISFKFSSVHHPGVTYGYRIKVGDKTVIYVSDNECLFLEKSINMQYQQFNETEKEIYDEMKKEEYQTEVDLVRDADILIHDAQYTSADYRKKRGWGHSCYVDTVTLAMDANVKTLYLYHHDPNYDDMQIQKIHLHALQLIKQRKSKLKCHVACEGMQVDLS